MKQKLSNFLDIFYPPFRKIMPLQTFRYAACGGANTVLGLLVYFIALNYIFDRENVDLGFYVFKPHNAALFVSFVVSFTVGFLLNKYLVFIESNLRGRIQLFRYLLSFLLNLVINYFLLKFFVESLKIEAFTAQVITTFIVVTFSYLSQRHFSFKVRPTHPEF
jgi:putative flippase GtrA